MDFDQLGNCYKLTDLQMSPDRLLLDPSNPRLVASTGDENIYSLTEAASPEVQNHIYAQISKSEHDIDQLIQSIRKRGFVQGMGTMWVQKIPGTGKYLTIEGNRRLTAIRYLRDGDGGTLSRNVRRSMEKLDVKAFAYIKGSPISEEEVKDTMLAIIHLGGAKAWGAMEKAHFTFKCYKRELNSRFPAEPFAYRAGVAKSVAEMVNSTPPKIRTELAVARVFDQLLQNKYAVQPGRYSLLDLVVKNKKLARGYFGLDDRTLQFSTVGMERFSTLCLIDDCPIHDPGTFRAFNQVFLNGTENDCRLVETGSLRLWDVLYNVAQRSQKKGFAVALSKIKDAIMDLRLADYQSLKKEDRLIAQIKKLIDGRLMRLRKKKGRRKV